MDVIVNVTTPGVESNLKWLHQSFDINALTSSWQVTLINTALLSTMHPFQLLGFQAQAIHLCRGMLGLTNPTLCSKVKKGL